MYLKTFEEMKKTSAFFMLKPVNAVYGFIVTVCIAIAAVTVWACAAPMDDVVKAKVLLRPSRAVSSVRCVTSGELYLKSFHNDETVEKGDLLFALDTTALKTELESYKELQEKNEGDLYVYEKLLQTISSGKITDAEKETDAYRKANAYLLEKSRYETVVEDARIKYERERDAPPALKVPQTAADLENQYRQTKLTYETWQNNQKIQAAEKLDTLKAEKKSIESRIEELERTIKNSTIYAPVEGRISESIKLNTGDYILAGEEVLRIVPQDDETLEAEIYVDPSYVARVKVGNPVKLKFPGLAPSRYGMVETKVSLVPPDVSVMENGNTAFVVKAVIDNPYLKTKQGQTARLLPGITAEGRILIERCTVMQMIMRKLDFIN